jgi:hypothetical protein
MKSKNIIFWILAIIITLASAYYQRITGPTYPKSGSISLNDIDIKYNLDRSYPGEGDCLIKLNVPSADIKGTLIWKRHNTKDADKMVEMRYENGILTAELPHQPPAGKLDYQIRLLKENVEKYIPSKDSYVVIRFRGDVPWYVLIPHIIVIFLAMLFSTRTGIEFFNKEPNYKRLLWWTLGAFFIGGFILGPLVQKFAFGEYWTGVPFGWDLTDNKTLIAFVGWLIALIGHRKSQKPDYWILGAALLTLIVFLIPHSVLGSELDYSKVN